MRTTRSSAAAAATVADQSPIHEIEQLPAVLLISEVARIYRLHPETIRKKLRQGVFRPQPFDTHPYRWRRVDLLDDIERKPAEHVRRRPHKKVS